MSIEDQDSRSTGQGFWKSVPVLVTAVAAVITAVGGLLFALNRQDSPPVQPQPPINLVVAPGPVPQAPAIISPGQLDTGSLTEDVASSSAETLVADCVDGDSSACELLVVQLIDECDQGVGLSCDGLYLLSPVGTDIEMFGATCGARLESTTQAGQCRFL